jgi:branched-chain amino acid transport system ATP-binding protein
VAIDPVFAGVTALLAKQGGAMSTYALEVRDVHKRFGQVEVMRGATLQVKAGERCVVIGPNGAGKSSLFNLISGVEVPDRGDVVLHGKPIQGLPSYDISRMGLARSFQVSSLFLQLSVYENLRCAVLWTMGYRYTFWRRLSRLQKVADKAQAVLTQIGLEHRRDVTAAQLSYAEQRMLELGITIASGADVILLDEPTAGMSKSESTAMVELIRSVTVGKTLLMVEHDMQVVFELADRITVLAEGRVVMTDVPDIVRANQEVQRLYLGAS